MAIVSASLLHFSSCAPFCRIPISVARFSGASASMDSSGDGDLRFKFMEFPHASVTQRNLMVDLLSSVDNRLGPSLQSCTLPRDVQHFTAGAATASLQLRTGLPSSQIEFILESWIHCKLPSNGSLNIMSLSAYLKSSTNAPHFVLELIQPSPTSLVFVLDWTPRKDLILYPDYLKTYYQDTNLDSYRKQLQVLPEVKPYISPYLYLRAVISPTAILVNVDVGTGNKEKMEEITQEQIRPAAKEVLQIWMDTCACLERSVSESESERAYLAERDGMIKKYTVDVELPSSLPRLYGQEVADRVVGALKEYYYK